MNRLSESEIKGVIQSWLKIVSLIDGRYGAVLNIVQYLFHKENQSLLKE